MSSDNETIAMRITDKLAALPVTERSHEKLASHVADEMDLVGANLNEEVLVLVTRAVFARNLVTSPINEVFAARIVEEVAALHPVDRYEEKLAKRLAITVHYLGSEYNGDEIIQLVSQGLADRNLIEPEYEPMTQQEEALDGWAVPDLSERRAIWRNFPVVVKPHALGCADGKDRYDIVWHHDNYDAWRNERTESSDEAMLYEDWVRWRMEHAFAQYSDTYTVEGSTDPNVIYRIAVAAEEHEAPKRRALDVLREQGLMWKRDGAIHDVRPPTTGMSAEARSVLVAALEACSDCVVMPRTGFVCRLVIAADKATAAAIAAEIVETAAPVPAEGLFDLLKRFMVRWDRGDGGIHDIKIDTRKCPRTKIGTETANLLAALRSRSDCRVGLPVSSDYICRLIKK